MAFARTAARKTFASRYMIVPCEAEGDLAVIWDRQEEQVVDVICASAGRYSDEDALWDEFHAPAPVQAAPQAPWRLAA